MNRLNPVRMRAKAKADISEKRAKLQDAVSNENVVREIVDRNEEELETMNFAFNEADTIVIGPENVTIFKVVGENTETDGDPEETTVR